jgi:hypothetical protein
VPTVYSDFSSYSSTIPEQYETTPESDNDSIVRLTVEECSDLEEFGTLYATSTTKDSSNLDWAIIQINQNESPQTPNRALASNKQRYPILDYSTGKNGIEVMTCTGSKSADHGSIRGSSTLLKLERSRTYEEVWTVELIEALSKR